MCDASRRQTKNLGRQAASSVFHRCRIHSINSMPIRARYISSQFAEKKNLTKQMLTDIIRNIPGLHAQK